MVRDPSTVRIRKLLSLVKLRIKDSENLVSFAGGVCLEYTGKVQKIRLYVGRSRVVGLFDKRVRTHLEDRIPVSRT